MTTEIEPRERLLADCIAQIRKRARSAPSEARGVYVSKQRGCGQPWSWLRRWPSLYTIYRTSTFSLLPWAYAHSNSFSRVKVFLRTIHHCTLSFKPIIFLNCYPLNLIKTAWNADRTMCLVSICNFLYCVPRKKKLNWPTFGIYLIIESKNFRRHQDCNLRWKTNGKIRDHNLTLSLRIV